MGHLRGVEKRGYDYRVKKLTPNKCIFWQPGGMQAFHPECHAARSEKAVKYTFNPFLEKWQGSKCRVTVDKQPFASGGMRFCLRLFELEENGDFMPCVAKIFKKNAMRTESYFDEALTQMAAECFAQQFNRRQNKFRVAFLPVSVMMLVERQKQLCCVEPMMRGAYVKHNDNDGHVETNSTLPQTFSHYTWEASKHSLIVVDIQGVGDCYTDPQIHTIEGASFGKGNMGREGCLKFLKSHKCNRVCEYLKLPPMCRSLAVEQVEKAKARVQEVKEKCKRGMAQVSMFSNVEGFSSQRVSPGRQSPHRSSQAVGGTPQPPEGAAWRSSPVGGPTSPKYSFPRMSGPLGSPLACGPSLNRELSTVHRELSTGSLQGVQVQGLESAVAALEHTELNEEQAAELQDLKKHIEQLKKLQSSLDRQNEA